MKKCIYCGGENPDDNKFCMNCGAPLGQESQDTAEQQEHNEENLPVQTQVPEPAPEQVPSGPDHYEQQPYVPTGGMSGQAVEPVPIGGLIAWAIFNTLGCLIPGAVALFYIFKINKASSYEEQQQLLTNTKRILIVGTVLCVLNLFLQFASR